MDSGYIPTNPTTVCPEENISRQGPGIYEFSRSILAGSRGVWPLASRWLGALEQAYAAEPKQAEEVNSVGLVPKRNLLC